jgi:predicted DNA-binding transcriptional regulator AlpA
MTAAASDQRRLLDVREAALRLGLSKSTLDKMRCSGRGPRFIRATDRAIRYDPLDLDAFAAERRRRSTSEDVLAALGS